MSSIKSRTYGFKCCAVVRLGNIAEKWKQKKCSKYKGLQPKTGNNNNNNKIKLYIYIYSRFLSLQSKWSSAKSRC
uniref:Uncharacterized protein n=1 Tax=Podoviridae sp. ctlpi2 TaxID=2826574 RepID=A0A8S5MLU3_9CAUD|nr:MAG TPA: hypothetical protein [Podoviridae sp. ctlpi2]